LPQASARLLTDELIAGVVAHPKFRLSLINMSSPREGVKAIALPAPRTRSGACI
jgi:hypothetical protein